MSDSSLPPIVELAPDDVVVAARNQVWTSLGDEAAILHLGSSTYYALRGAGPRIWELVQHPVSVSALVRAIVAEYEVEPARCERDVLALLRELAVAGLIRRDDSASGDDSASH